MKLVLISDTHGRHHDITIPSGDVLIHAGDFSYWPGDIDELRRFNEFLGELPHPYKILVAGNHDHCFEQLPENSRASVTNARYLQDDAIEIDGLVFYGSPWQPEFLDLAFNLPRGRALREKWEKIPQDTDVLITHGPPHKIGDRTFDGRRVGCEELLERVCAVRPKLHVFGHIHEGRGRYEKDGTLFVNAAMPDSDTEPFVVELPAK